MKNRDNFACLLNANGSAKELSLDEVAATPQGEDCLWIHLNYTDEHAIKWLTDESNIEPVIVDALLAEDSRPRVSVIGNGLLIALRGINLGHGAEPEDMVSIRLWIDGKRIISTRQRNLVSISDILQQYSDGQGPATSGDFLVALVERLVWRMSDTVDQYEDLVADIEEQVLNAQSQDLRLELANLRRRTIAIRRYLAPQRDALMKLVTEKVSWLSDNHHLCLRESNDRLIRHIEDIDAVRDRAAVTQEELQSRLAELTNARMYVLSVVAAIFLPLGFLTGLLGINIPGIPGSEYPQAFAIFSLVILVIVVLQILIFRWRKWM